MERIEICYKCGIYNSELKICDSRLYIDPETNKVSTTPKEGYIKGCNCYIPRKVLKINAKCPARKW